MIPDAMIEKLMRRSAGFDQTTPRPSVEAISAWQETFERHNLTAELVWQVIPDACLDMTHQRTAPVLARIVAAARAVRRDMIERSPELQAQIEAEINANVAAIESKPLRAIEPKQGVPDRLKSLIAGFGKRVDTQDTPKRPPLSTEDEEDRARRREAARAELDRLRGA